MNNHREVSPSARERAERVRASIDALLPPTGEWGGRLGYPSSVALCVLDAIWSINAKYDSHVVPVLTRYCAHRGFATLGECTDGAEELQATIGEVGGPVAFAEHVVNNRQRTSTRSGILKAEACLQAARLLVDAPPIGSALFAANSDELRQRWRQIAGQRSGISWRYFLMLTGVEDVKPDRMIHRFITAAIHESVTDAEATDVLHQVADTFPERITLRALDHAIWRFESDRVRHRQNRRTSS